MTLTLDSDPTYLLPQHLDQVIQLPGIALAKHIHFGYSYGLLAHVFREPPHAIIWDNIDRLRPSSLDLYPRGMAAAHQRTTDRVNGGLHSLDASPSTTP